MNALQVSTDKRGGAFPWVNFYSSELVLMNGVTGNRNRRFNSLTGVWGDWIFHPKCIFLPNIFLLLKFSYTVWFLEKSSPVTAGYQHWSHGLKSLQLEVNLYIFLGGSVALEHIVSCLDFLITEVSETWHGPRLSWSLSVPRWKLRQKQICICICIFIFISIYICIYICICVHICICVWICQKPDKGPDYPDIYQYHAGN